MNIHEMLREAICKCGFVSTTGCRKRTSGGTGGLQNQVFSQYTSVVGGLGNNVCAGNYSSILGGKNNVVNGAYSTILGGSGNTDSGYNYVGMFGQNLVASCPNTFYVECLNAINTPIGPGFAATGTFYYQTGVPLPAPWNTCCFVFIK